VHVFWFPIILILKLVFSAYIKLNKVRKVYHARDFYLFYFRNDPKAARSRIDALESPAGPADLYLQILK
jgi:hypothetical protein